MQCFIAYCSLENSWKMKNIFTNVELNILKSDVDWFLSMCNNYIQETAIKSSIWFSGKSCNKKNDWHDCVNKIWITTKSDSFFS